MTRNSNDPVFNELQVWVDANGDACVGRGRCRQQIRTHRRLERRSRSRSLRRYGWIMALGEALVEEGTPSFPFCLNKTRQLKKRVSV